MIVPRHAPPAILTEVVEFLLFSAERPDVGVW
jgi:hypothetical protein